MRRLPLLLALVLAAGPLAAQDPPDLPPDTEPFDVEVFRAVYDLEAPLLVVPMRVVNDTAYPAFVAAAPGLALGAALDGGDYDPALRMGASQALSATFALAVKRLVRRPRPFAALDGVASRDRHYQGDEVLDPFSFPSGHTALAVATAASLSLSAPEWYVMVPAATWAATMGAARIWHGVHYPSDVLVGAGLGVASAVAVHVLLPDVFDGEKGASAALRIAIPL